MHPAFSVIFFTTASGAGYGMLVVLGITTATGFIPADRTLGILALGLAFVLVTAGLLSSMFHLGHPERAWRAFSQWRSSWLAREGVASVITYGPWMLLAYVWIFMGDIGGLGKLAAVISAVLALVTIYCTSMIYRSLATVHQWSNGWTVPLYLILGLATGIIWVGAIQVLTVGIQPIYILISIVAVMVAWRIQRHYWKFIDTTNHPMTTKDATGLKGERVRLLEGPHTEENYLMQEMGFKIGRKHADKLRRLVHIFGFGLPMALLFVSYFLGGYMTTAAFVLSALSMSFGIFVSRWLFFAQARHVVTLYYGAEAA